MITALIPFITGALGQVIDRVVPDVAGREAAKLNLEAELLKLAGESNLAQIGLNTAEAQHRSIFVVGWRPAIGWTCALALAYQFIVSPMTVWGGAVAGYELPVPPSLDDMLWELLFGMMGMAGLRTFEKSRGLTS
ncbi:MAG: 3TM-type holin [Alphaproteobacteria bacterium]|jgi:hypothetical protein|nr:hypothetical protein [Rhodospirillaceae bacterium]MBT7612123.1 hypothetical protein [Rhodospirillaceae bacterium]MDG2479676.1 3TM-type holin [Alphaproteobacteria bacterium]